MSQFSRAKNYFTSVQKLCIKSSLFTIYILPVLNIFFFSSRTRTQWRRWPSYKSNNDSITNHSIILKHVFLWYITHRKSWFRINRTIFFHSSNNFSYLDFGRFKVNQIIPAHDYWLWTWAWSYAIHIQISSFHSLLTWPLCTLLGWFHVNYCEISPGQTTICT